MGHALKCSHVASSWAPEHGDGFPPVSSLAEFSNLLKKSEIQSLFLSHVTRVCLVLAAGARLGCRLRLACSQPAVHSCTVTEGSHTSLKAHKCCLPSLKNAACDAFGLLEPFYSLCLPVASSGVLLLTDKGCGWRLSSATAGWKLTGCQPSPALCNEGAGVGDRFPGGSIEAMKKPCPTKKDLGNEIVVLTNY